MTNRYWSVCEEITEEKEKKNGQSYKKFFKNIFSVFFHFANENKGFEIRKNGKREWEKINKILMLDLEWGQNERIPRPPGSLFNFEKKKRKYKSKC